MATPDPHASARPLIAERMIPPRAATVLTDLVDQSFTTVERVLGNGRDRESVRVRRAFVQAMRHKGVSLPLLGLWLDRDHTSIHYLASTKDYDGKMRCARCGKRYPRGKKWFPTIPGVRTIPAVCVKCRANETPPGGQGR